MAIHGVGCPRCGDTRVSYPGDWFTPADRVRMMVWFYQDTLVMNASLTWFEKVKAALYAVKAAFAVRLDKGVSHEAR